MANFWDNKIVWITGASSGIGEALVKQISSTGAKLILSGRKEAALQALAQPLGERAAILPFDLAKKEEVQAALQKVNSFFGRVDVLFNNGGISQRSYGAETSDEVERQIMEVNYFANIALTKGLIPQWRERKEGYVCTVGSMTSLFGFFYRTTYGASKHAVKGYYESLIFEEEPNGVHITIVYPGFINTPISANSLNGDGSKHNKLDEAQKQGMAPEVCVKRMIEAVENKERSVVIAKKERMAHFLHKLSFSLFYNVLKKQKPL